MSIAETDAAWFAAATVGFVAAAVSITEAFEVRGWGAAAVVDWFAVWFVAVWFDAAGTSTCIAWFACC